MGRPERQVIISVLLVEPEPVANVAFNAALTKHGFAVTSVYSQAEFKHALRLGGFHLFVLGESSAASEDILLEARCGGAPVIVAEFPVDERNLVKAIQFGFDGTSGAVRLPC